MSRHNPIFTFNAELDRFLNQWPRTPPYHFNPNSNSTDIMSKPAANKWKTVPTKKINKPIVPEPVLVEDDSDDEYEEAGANDDGESQPMDEAEYPTLASSPTRQTEDGDSKRPVVMYTRIQTDAPLVLKGLMYAKNFGGFSIAVSKADAKMCNLALVEELGCDPSKPLIKWNEDFGAWILRGKAQGNLKLNYDNIEPKRSYNVKFNVGTWAMPSEMKSGVSASIIDLIDEAGNSLAKLDIKFPSGTSFSVGRKLTKEEVEERKRNQ